MISARRTSNDTGWAASTADTVAVVATANSAVRISSGRAGPSRSITLPCATDPSETPASAPAVTSPPAAKDPVTRCTYSSVARPNIAIGSRPSAEASTGNRAPGAVRAAR